MGRILLEIFKDYGLGVTQLGVICYFGWKLATNHLKHIQDSITSIDKKIDTLNEEIKKANERISFIEGKIT